MVRKVAAVLAALVVGTATTGFIAVSRSAPAGASARGPVQYSHYPNMNLLRVQSARGNMPAGEVFYTRTFRGSNWSGRVLVLSDGCIITDASQGGWCIDAATADMRQMTPAEARSYKAAEAALARYAKGVRH